MVTFTDYAAKRIRRRKISEQRVIDVVSHPEQVLEIGARRIAQSRQLAGGKEHLLRVIYEVAANGDVLVITVYDTSKVKKYWRPT